MSIALSAQIAAGLLIVSLLSGVWLHRRGRPLPVVLVTVHKLLALATAGLFVAALVQGSTTGPLSTPVWIVVVVGGLGFVAAVASGGLLSRERPLPGTVVQVHRIGAALMTLGAVGLLYLALAL